MLQSFSTTAKLIAIFAIVTVAFIAGSSIGASSNWTQSSAIGTSVTGWALLGPITLAMSGAFWAYDGWGNVSYIAGEVRDPSKTIPRAIIMGTLTFITLYMLVNLAYFYVLGLGGVANAPNDRVASEMISRVVGGGGASIIAALILLSTFDTTNSTVLTNARVYYAMAEHGVFYPGASRVHPKFQTPYVSLLMQGGWSLVLLLTGSFGLITDMYVFVNWVLYVLMALAVFILRRRNPGQERPFKVPGYPYIPAIFMIFATLYVVITLVTDIQAYQAGTQPLVKSVTGIVLVLSGLPFYYFWKTKRTTGQ
jgi:APA family basic amino acid/polyamine antiporter